MSDAAGWSCPKRRLPGWVPRSALNYLVHTETGVSIRALARRAGCHASTVSRQVRALEARREDRLVDAALRRLGQRVQPGKPAGSSPEERRMTLPPDPFADEADLTERRLKTEARRVLQALAERGAVLAVAADMEKAVVVRDAAAGAAPGRGAVVDREIAEALALKGWIACDAPGRVSRYRITAAGRTELNRLLAEDENRASGFAESQADFAGQHRVWDERTIAGERGRRARVRFNAAESPLTLLARRRDKDGQKFLSPDLVRAGERLREDFEMANIGPRVTQNWDQFLTGPVHSAPGTFIGGAEAARERVVGALRDLGPGLGDVVLRCCCYLEGLESAERRMGWSARSGKIVLRIALQRLARHYERLGEAGGMIG